MHVVQLLSYGYCDMGFCGLRGWIGNRHAVGIGWGRELVRGKKM